MKTRDVLKFDHNEGKIIHHKQFNNDPYVEKAAQLRELNGGRIGESVCAGIIPMHILNEWFKEAGVSWDDTQATSEVVKKKLLSGEFDKLRVWEGRF